MPASDIAVVVERLDNLKDYVTERFVSIETQLQGKCDQCPNMVELRTKVNFQWWVIGIATTIIVTSKVLG